MVEIKSYKRISLYVLVIFIILVLISVFFSLPPYKYLGNGYVYHSEYYYITGNTKEEHIPPNVIKYKNSSQYVTAMQVPLRNIYQLHLPDEFDSLTYVLDMDTTYYWIIEKQKHIVYGPLLWEEYVSKCDDLSIKLSQRVK